jgi:hypothetical protein
MTNLEFIFENLGPIWKIVDYELILGKIRGLFVKLALISGWGFIFKPKIAWRT